MPRDCVDAAAEEHQSSAARDAAIDLAIMTATAGVGLRDRCSDPLAAWVD